MANPEMTKEIRRRIEAFSSTADKRPSVAVATRHAMEALNLAENIAVQAAQVRNNTLWPAEHRQKMLRDGTTETVKKVQRLENNIADAFKSLSNERRFAERLPKAPIDPVSIQIRSDMRKHLREMDPEKRYAAVRLGQIDADMLAAVLEAPGFASNLPQPLVDALRSQVVAAKGVPNFSSTDEELSTLAKVAIDVARGAAGEASAMDPGEFGARVAGVRSELEAGVDHSDSDLPTLLAVAQGRAA